MWFIIFNTVPIDIQEYLPDMQRFEHVRFFLINQEAETSSFKLAYRKGHVLSGCERALIEIIEKTAREKME